MSDRIGRSFRLLDYGCETTPKPCQPFLRVGYISQEAAETDAETRNHRRQKNGHPVHRTLVVPEPPR